MSGGALADRRETYAVPEEPEEPEEPARYRPVPALGT